MNIGELLDRAITLYRRNFLTLVGIVAIVNVPYLLVQIVAIILAIPTDLTNFSQRSSNFSSNSFLIYFAALVIVAIPVGIAYIFQHGALTVVASESFLGRKIGIKEAYGRAWQRGWTLFGTQFVIGLANVLVVGLLFIPFIALIALAPGVRGSSGNAALGIAVLCLCAAFLPALALIAILNNFWIFWPQTIMLESKGVRSGLGRSWQIVRGSFWRVFLIAVLAYIFISIITATPTYAISILSAMFPSSLFATAFNSTVSILISIFTTPLWLALNTLLYYDIRIRKEGFDLELQAQQLVESPA